MGTVRGYNRGAVARSDNSSSHDVVTMRRILILLGIVLFVILIKSVVG